MKTLKFNSPLIAVLYYTIMPLAAICLTAGLYMVLTTVLIPALISITDTIRFF